MSWASQSEAHTFSFWGTSLPSLRQYPRYERRTDSFFAVLSPESPAKMVVP